MSGVKHLARIGGHSRPTGSAGVAEARQYCADVLRNLGFEVSERKFEYSQFPGRWATPAAGFFIPAAATAVVAVRASSGPWIPIALTLTLASIIGIMFIARRGVLGIPFARATGVNLEATRGSDEPTVWLTAHIDSKWQPVSMLMRVAGVLLTSISLGGLVVALLAQSALIVDFLAALWVGSVPLMLSVVGARNHGTLDNASGVAALLEAIEQLPQSLAIGVLITDAEELALAGAMAWAIDRRPGVALNCDSVDDDGEIVAMYSGTIPHELIAAVENSAAANAERFRALRLIPGILTDSVALSNAGWRALTVSRGTLRTLGRIHTSRDSFATMSGRGISGVARVLARAVEDAARA